MFRFGEYWHRVSSPFLAWVEGRTLKQSKANVHAHYDSQVIFISCSWTDKKYSCAYFAHDSDSLETAQSEKQHIINKLPLKRMTRLILDAAGAGLVLIWPKWRQSHWPDAVRRTICLGRPTPEKE